jgi:hypothetical protein
MNDFILKQVFGFDNQIIHRPLVAAWGLAEAYAFSILCTEYCNAKQFDTLHNDWVCVKGNSLDCIKELENSQVSKVLARLEKIGVIESRKDGKDDAFVFRFTAKSDAIVAEAIANNPMPVINFDNDF